MDSQNRLNFEIEWERSNTLQGKLEFYKQHVVRDDHSTTLIGKTIKNSYTHKFIEAVSVTYQDQPKYLRAILDDVGVPEVSYLFISALLGLLSFKNEEVGDINIQRLQNVFWKKLVDQYMIEQATKVDSQLTGNLLNKYPNRRRLMRAIEHFFELEVPTTWQARGGEGELVASVKLTTYLFEQFSEVTGFTALRRVHTEGSKTPIEIVFTEKFMDFIQSDILESGLLPVQQCVMLDEPLDWAISEEGHNLKVGPMLWSGSPVFPLVRGYSETKLKQIKPQILDAVNALQRVKWRINTQVFSIFEQIWEGGGGIAGIPHGTKKLPPEAYAGLSDKDRAKKLSDHAARLGLRTQIASAIHHANEVLRFCHKRNMEPYFYFPHFLDFRGRIYPLPAPFTPQATDYLKGWLEFHEGKRLGESGVRWLAIDGANHYGKDKLKLQDRVNWTDTNTSWICACADDPMEHTEWMEADKPFQFLRFCFEWKKVQKHGADTISHIPVGVDATCSGLQVYSALLRDEVGGAAVNLVPMEDRQDVYEVVADRTKELLMANGSKAASQILEFGFDRSATKRQVMTVPYAATMSSCIKYTRKYIMEKIEGGRARTWDEEHDFEVILLFAQCIWEAIGDVVVKAREGMNYLCQIASMHTSQYPTRAITWETPDGWRARQFVRETKKHKISTWLDGSVLVKDLVIDRRKDEQGRIELQLRFGRYQDTVDRSKMRTSIAPNVVHSLDACVLRKTILRGLQHGITNFQMIHDDFGVHAADMELFLSACIKPAFIETFEGNYLQDFAAQQSHIAGIEELEQPTPGTLDLQGVHDLEFIYS